MVGHVGELEPIYFSIGSVACLANNNSAVRPKSRLGCHSEVCRMTEYVYFGPDIPELFMYKDQWFSSNNTGTNIGVRKNARIFLGQIKASSG